MKDDDTIELSKELIDILVNIGIKALIDRYESCKTLDEENRTDEDRTI